LEIEIKLDIKSMTILFNLISIMFDNDKFACVFIKYLLSLRRRILNSIRSITGGEKNLSLRGVFCRSNLLMSCEGIASSPKALLAMTGRSITLIY